MSDKVWSDVEKSLGRGIIRCDGPEWKNGLNKGDITRNNDFVREKVKETKSGSGFKGSQEIYKEWIKGQVFDYSIGEHSTNNQKHAMTCSLVSCYKGKNEACHCL